MLKTLFYVSLVSFSTLALAQEENAFEFLFSEPRVGTYSQRIMDLASSSSCAKYSWKSRGTAPAGYIKGVSLSFARSYCRLKASGVWVGPAPVISEANTKNDAKDALTHYQSTLSSLGMPINVAGIDTMRADFVLGMGLGMRESSGAYCEGWDTSAGSNRPSSEAEAGAFQVSYNSIGADSHLQKLYTEYQSTPNRCLLDVFKQGASCRGQSILGSGAGAAFQLFNKQCPAFATEYAMTLLRVLRAHFGPINRREAEVHATCDTLLKSVQQVVESNTNAACAELL